MFNQTLAATLKGPGLGWDRIEFAVDATRVGVAVMRRDGYKSPIVFLHGFGSTKEDYADIARYPIFDGHPVIAYDAPGCGATDCDTPSAIDIPFQQKTAQAVLAHFGFDHFHLVGHSMGGLTALMLAHANRESVLSFTNIEGNLGSEDCFLSRQTFEYGQDDAEYFLDAFIDRVFRSPGFANAVYATGLRGKVRARAVASIFRSMVELSDHAGLLQKFLALPCPKSFVFGDAHRSLSYLGQLRDNGVALFEIPACGHFPMYSNPPLMWRAISDFIHGIEGNIRR